MNSGFKTLYKANIIPTRKENRINFLIGHKDCILPIFPRHTHPVILADFFRLHFLHAGTKFL